MFFFEFLCFAVQNVDRETLYSNRFDGEKLECRWSLWVNGRMTKQLDGGHTYSQGQRKR